MYTIHKYPEGITLNPREYALNDKDEVIKFKTTDDAVKYLLPHFDFVEMLDHRGIHIEKEEDDD